MDMAGLFPPDVAVAAAPIALCSEPVFTAERAAIENAVSSRQAEFRAGRQCARMAMKRLGMATVAIPAGASREPCWPPGIVGSISHDSLYCIAAVARRSRGYRGIGIDIEAAGGLDENLVDIVCTPAERMSMRAMTFVDAGLHAKAIFSIKESVFKCQFPFTGAWLEFTDLDVAIAPDRCNFEAVFLRDAGELRQGSVIGGRLRETADFVASVAWLKT